MAGDQRCQPDEQGGAGNKRRHDVDLELRAWLVDNILSLLKPSGDAVALPRRKQQRSDKDVVIYASRIRCGADPVIEAPRCQASHLDDQQCAYDGYYTQRENRDALDYNRRTAASIQ